jgi:hypothetical protein
LDGDYPRKDAVAAQELCRVIVAHLSHFCRGLFEDLARVNSRASSGAKSIDLIDISCH